jgi:hypothetical protein
MLWLSQRFSTLYAFARLAALGMVQLDLEIQVTIKVPSVAIVIVWNSTLLQSKVLI